MRYAHSTRRELGLCFDGTGDDLDLDFTELLAGHHHDVAAVLVETGPECDELAGVADLLAEFDQVLYGLPEFDFEIHELAEFGPVTLAPVVELHRPAADVMPLGEVA